MTFGLFPKAQLDGYSAFLILGAVMRRREFIALAGGAAFSGPLTAQAQQNVLPGVGGTVILTRAKDADQARKLIEEYRRSPEEETAEIAIAEDPEPGN